MSVTVTSNTTHGPCRVWAVSIRGKVLAGEVLTVPTVQTILITNKRNDNSHGLKFEASAKLGN